VCGRHRAAAASARTAVRLRQSATTTGSDMSNKLKDLECPLPEPYVVHYIHHDVTPILFYEF
jgi:hypothetical protein